MGDPHPDVQRLSCGILRTLRAAFRFPQWHKPHSPLLYQIHPLLEILLEFRFLPTLLLSTRRCGISIKNVIDTLVNTSATIFWSPGMC